MTSSSLDVSAQQSSCTEPDESFFNSKECTIYADDPLVFDIGEKTYNLTASFSAGPLQLERHDVDPSDWSYIEEEGIFEFEGLFVNVTNITTGRSGNASLEVFTSSCVEDECVFFHEGDFGNANTTINGTDYGFTAESLYDSDFNVEGYMIYINSPSASGGSADFRSLGTTKNVGGLNITYEENGTRGVLSDGSEPINYGVMSFEAVSSTSSDEDEGDDSGENDSEGDKSEENDPQENEQEYWRLQDNSCKSIMLLPSEADSRDYNSEQECERNVVEDGGPQTGAEVSQSFYDGIDNGPWEKVSRYDFDSGDFPYVNDVWGENTALSLVEGVSLTESFGYRGAKDSALQFDGNGYLKAPVNLSGENFGVMAWVNFDNKRKYSNIVSKWGWDGDQFNLQLDESGENFVFRVSSDSGELENVRSSTKAKTGEWQHVAGFWNGTHIAIYVNGNQEDVKELEGDLDEGEEPFSLGAENDGGVVRFKGKMDDVRVYRYDDSASDGRLPEDIRSEGESSGGDGVSDLQETGSSDSLEGEESQSENRESQRNSDGSSLLLRIIALIGSVLVAVILVIVVVRNE